MAPVRRSSRNKNKTTTKSNSPKKQNVQNSSKKKFGKKSKNTPSKIETSTTINESELNSSPIKRATTPTKTFNETNNSNTNPNSKEVGGSKNNQSNIISVTPTRSNQYKGPAQNTRRKKCVLFSDDLVSDLPSSPDRSTPKRSILKACDINLKTQLTDPNNSTLWEKSTLKQPHGPKYTNFWCPGTIVQLPPNSDELPMLVEGCLSVLSVKTFDKRFEVYATLNSVLKTNSRETIFNLFTKSMEINHDECKSKESTYLQKLVFHLIQDIDEIEDQIFKFDNENKENTSPSKNDPFRVRIINQALKLLNCFMVDPNVNCLISIEDADWIYRHAISMLTHPRISKTLVSPYLSIIKDCHLNAMKKRELFSNSELIEKMLFALMNMNSFPSATLVSEKLLCIKNYIINFPNSMSKNIGHWFESVLLNLCNISSPLYMKCLGFSVNCLMETAKTFLDNNNVQIYIRKLLSSTISNNVKFFSIDEEYSQNLSQLSSQNIKLVDFVNSKLQKLCDEGHHKLALDSWMALTVLIGNGQTSFEKWSQLNSWLVVPQRCLESKDPAIIELVLNSWKAVNFNLCKDGLLYMRKELDPILRGPLNNEKKTRINQIMKPKVELLTHVFLCMDVPNLPSNIINSLHNLFLGILYMIINSNVLKVWSKNIHLLWDRIIQPVFLNFYFKKNSSTNYLNLLGFRILATLLKLDLRSRKTYSDINVLATENLTSNDLTPLPSRWVHSHFDKIMQNIYLVFSLKKLEFEDKLSMLIIFLNTLSQIVKKERVTSTTTYDLIDNLPLVLSQLLKNHDLICTERIKEIIIELQNTFKTKDLLSRGPDENLDVYFTILSNSKMKFDEESKHIYATILKSLDFTKTLIFICNIVKSDIFEDSLKSFLIAHLSQLNLEISRTTVICYGEICQFVKTGYHIFVKKLFRSILSTSNTEDITLRWLGLLNMQHWTLETSQYALLLFRESSNEAFLRLFIPLITNQLESWYNPTLQFLILNDFAVVISELRDQIFDIGSRQDATIIGDICLMLENYLKNKLEESEINYDLIDKLGYNCLKIFKMNISFLNDHLQNLPLLNQEINTQVSESSDGSLNLDNSKHSLSELAISIPSVIYKDITQQHIHQPTQEESNGQLLQENSTDSSGFSEVENRETATTGKESTTKSSVPHLDQDHDMMMDELAESENISSNSSSFPTLKTTKAEASASESIETAVDDSNIKIPPNTAKVTNDVESREETISESESTFITQRNDCSLMPQSKEDTIANTSSIDVNGEEKNNKIPELEKVLPDSIESVNSSNGQYNTAELVRLLDLKSYNELSLLSNEEKYEIETKLLNFMLKLRNIKS
ncbi:RIF1 [Candida pseudojiufengensis]|uniref:RIF1 n=1 Tax=Candida pseudojiufengensis TaxID=497109 RepID=UPI002224A03A|nr:RIF1 [Candida pseudojiufengensis]KAI5966302.1 RIF1 [Candida pseudojiufengensis]